MWKYFSEKRITNLGGSLDGVLQCSELDQATYEYTWRSQDRVMDFRFISFGLL